VLARDVSVALSRAPDSSIVNILPARIVSLREGGADTVTLRLALEGGTAHLLARITRRSCVHLGLQVGTPVFAQVKGAALMA
jgi:molybdate transport system ATP-binding protein